MPARPTAERVHVLGWWLCSSLHWSPHAAAKCNTTLNCRLLRCLCLTLAHIPLASPAGKIGKQIAQAVRQGGPDQVANARLREALAAAKMAQVTALLLGGRLGATCWLWHVAAGGTGQLRWRRSSCRWVHLL